MFTSSIIQIVTYLGRILDEDLSGDSMAMKILGENKMFIVGKQFPISGLRRPVCNA